MPTQIIDNFDLTSQLPLDARLVVGPNAFYQTKDSIQNKYYGLRVWDFNTNLPYVWTGASWSNENVGSVLVTNGLGGYLPKFTGAGSSNTVSNSIIYDTGTNRIGILKTNPNYTLDVNGSVSATSFLGNGSQINSINASNIVNGVFNLSLLNTSGAGFSWILSIPNNGGSATWRNNLQLRVGSSRALVVDDEPTSSNTFDLIFHRISDIFPTDLAPGTIQNPFSYYIKSARGTNRIQFQPSTGQLLLANGSATSPSLSFGLSTLSRGVGMYYDTTNTASNNGITFTINQNSGSKRLTLRAGGASPNFGTSLALYSNNTTKRFDITELDNSDTYFQQINGSGTIYFQNQNIFRVESAAQITSTLNVSSSITATGDITTNNNLFTNQKAVIGGTSLDNFSTINARLLVVADGTSGSALFTSNQWSAPGHQSTIYIGDSLHYIRSTYAGTFDIKSGDSIKLISGASTRLYLNNFTGHVGIGTESPTSRLTVNGNIRTDSDFVTGTDDAGWKYFVIPENGYFFSRTGAGAFNDVNYSNTQTDSFDRPHFRYKIIGKTALVSWRINGFNNAATGSFTSLYLKLPPDLQNIKDQYDGSTVKAQTDNGIGLYRRGAAQYGFFLLSPRQASYLPNATDWFLAFDYMGGGPFYNASSYDEYFVGSCFLEMA